MGRSLYQQREAVIQAIDRGTWKHSWHLPKDKVGDINWFSLETRQCVAEILKWERIELMELLSRLDQIEIPPESEYEAPK